MSLAPSSTLQHRYQIIRTVGSGGMGTVYLAEDARLRGRLCAVKEHRPDPGLDAVDLAKLRRQFEEREAGILAALDHPNLPKVFDYFSEDGNDYLVMEFVAGASLGDELERHKTAYGRPLPENVVLIWAQQVLEALRYLHSRPTGAIIHRDIKPANIILTDEGMIKLVDFGLAKLVVPASATLSESMRLGTLNYAPPEQFAAALGHTDERSDVFSMGATLYHLLTGEPPPPALERAAGVAAMAPAHERYGAISEPTSYALMQACALRKEERFPSAAAMGQALGLRFGADAGPSGQPTAASRAIQVPTPPPTSRSTPHQIATPPSRPPRRPASARGVSWYGLAALAVAGLAAWVVLLPRRLDSAAINPPVDPPEDGVSRSHSTAAPVEVTREVTVEGPVVEVTYQVTSAAPAPAPPIVSGSGSGASAEQPTGHIAFYSDVDGDDEIYIMSADGDDVRQVTDHPAADNYPSLSPDGRRIAFISNRDGNDEIYVVNTDGTGLQRLTFDDADDRLPAWSPDSTRIAFNLGSVGSRGIHVMDADGSNRTAIPNAHASSGHATWSPDGGSLVYNAGGASDATWEIERPALGSGSAMLLTSNGVIDWAPHWSPSGASVLFFSKRSGSADLWVMRADGRDQRALYSGPGYEWGGSWSPDEAFIAFTTEVEGLSNLFRIRADGTDLVPLTSTGGAYASWSR